MDRAVSNTGPILHLHEVDCLRELRAVGSIIIPPEVQRELRRSGLRDELRKMRFIKTAKMGKRGKDLSSLLARKYALDLGEAEAIALAKESNAKLLLTDDLDARDVAKRMGLEPSGTVGVLLRAYRRRILARKRTVDALRKLHSDSTLYITSDLVDLAVKAVRQYRRRT